jgi:fumarylacetoacetate (FAA) hydrolase
MFHPDDLPMERGWVGRIDGEHVVQLAAQTLESFFTGGGSAREHAVYPLDAVRLLAPVLHPPSVRLFEHEESFAFANPAAIVGPGAAVTRPLGDDRLQGGSMMVLARLAAVVGTEGAIAGFTILAEWRNPGRSAPKDRDFALGLGPVVVTADEVVPDGLGVEVRVAGGERRTGTFHGFDWSRAHELAADGTGLRPGDLLGSPALAPVAISAGNDVEVEVDRIGVLAQRLEGD